MINRLFINLLLLLYMTNFCFSAVSAAKVVNLYIEIDLWVNELLVSQNGQVIRRYPIAQGTDESPTPIGKFIVSEKSSSWGGGFGTRWLGLNVPWGIYGIHGTNKPHLIGKNVSRGCIRMFNEDIEELFEMIPEGTTVYIYGPITGNGKGEYKNLAVGSKGNLVQLVQERLKHLKLYHGKIDGIYEEETERAVKRFQKQNQLPINGVISAREYILLGILE